MSVYSSFVPSYITSDFESLCDSGALFFLLSSFTLTKSESVGLFHVKVICLSAPVALKFDGFDGGVVSVYVPPPPPPPPPPDAWVVN